MRVIVTGQIGMDKGAYLDEVAALYGERGASMEVLHLGEMMYREAPDVRPGKILDLPLSRLHTLRRATFRDLLAQASPSDEHPNVVVNTHATFRWHHGLFSAFDFDQIAAFKPDMFVCLLDNIESVHYRLHRDHDLDATLKDCIVWREEEIIVTELLAASLGKKNDFYVVSRGRNNSTAETFLRLTTCPSARKVYPSFPMSHVVDLPDVLEEIAQFRKELSRHFIAFDPADVDEKLLLDRAFEAAKRGEDFIEVEKPLVVEEQSKAYFKLPVREVLDIAGDVDGQIYMRDFRMIDQSDMICSLVPELANGIPGLSSGVERELQHAWEHTKEVYVVWKPRKQPSPFITETATKIFSCVDDAMSFFDEKGYLPERNLFGQTTP